MRLTISTELERQKSIPAPVDKVLVVDVESNPVSAVLACPVCHATKQLTMQDLVELTATKLEDLFRCSTCKAVSSMESWQEVVSGS